MPKCVADVTTSGTPAAPKWPAMPKCGRKQSTARQDGGAGAKPDGSGTSDGVATLGRVRGRGPRAKRSGRDSPEGAYRAEVPVPQAKQRRGRGQDARGNGPDGGAEGSGRSRPFFGRQDRRPEGARGRQLPSSTAKGGKQRPEGARGFAEHRATFSPAKKVLRQFSCTYFFE